jgi:hypothetical protein
LHHEEHPGPRRGHFISFVESRKPQLLSYRFSNYSFIRRRKLGLVHTIGHVLKLALRRNGDGYEITSRNYFAQFGQSRVARSSLSEAREKIEWQAFSYLLDELNQEARVVMWKQHRVFAADGTCLNLPHAPEIIENFPLDLDERCRAHYPKGLLLTLTDVLSGVPFKAELGHYRTDSERRLLTNVLPTLPKGSIVLLDRGFDGVKMFKRVADEGLFFIARVRSRVHEKCSLPVQDFLRSRKLEAVVAFTNEKGLSMKLRLLRFGKDSEGVPIVLVTNLFGGAQYSRSEIFNCYKKRWKIETFYLRIKRLVAMENFHSKSVNGIKQEIWATLFVLGMTAWLALGAIRMRRMNIAHVEPNFKNALLLLDEWLHLIIATRRRRRKTLLDQLCEEIARSVCIKQPGRKNLRIARRPQTSWRRPDGKNRARVQAEKQRAKRDP